MAGRRRAAGGALATLAFLACLGITAPQAFADIGIPDLLEPSPTPTTAEPAPVTEPVIEAVGDATIPSETTATVNDAISAASEPTSQPPAEEPVDAAMPAPPTVSSDAEDPSAGGTDPIGGTVSVPSAGAVETAVEVADTAVDTADTAVDTADTAVDTADTAVDTADTAVDMADSGVDSTVTPEVVGSVDTGSVADGLDPILDATAPLTGSLTDTRGSIDAIQSTVTDTFESGASAASDVTDTVETTIADADLPIGTDPAVEATADDLTGFLDVVSQVVQDVVPDASETSSGPVGSLVDTAAASAVALTGSGTDDIAAALDPAIGIVAVVDDFTAAIDPVVETVVQGVASVAESAGDAVGSVGDADASVGDAVGSVGDPVGDAVGSVGDPVGDAAGSVGDAVGSVGDAVGSVGDPVGDAAGSVGDAVGSVGDAVGSVGGAVSDPLQIGGATPSGSWFGASNGASTTESTASAPPARGSSSTGRSSTTAMQRDPRTRWNGDAADFLATVPPYVAAAAEVHTASDCPVESTLLCSLTLDLVDIGSLVDTVTSIVRILALTGASLLPWIGAGLLLAAVGALALIVARRRSTAVRSPADLGPDSWAYPEVVG